MTEIKPCPFCGSRCIIQCKYDCHGLVGMSVKCPGCRAQSDEFYCFNGASQEEVREQAIAAWNRRVKDNETD